MKKLIWFGILTIVCCLRIAQAAQLAYDVDSIYPKQGESISLLLVTDVSKPIYWSGTANVGAHIETTSKLTSGEVGSLFVMNYDKKAPRSVRKTHHDAGVMISSLTVSNSLLAMIAYDNFVNQAGNGYRLQSESNVWDQPYNHFDMGPFWTIHSQSSETLPSYPPLPSAIWLFGSVLVALIVTAKRKMTKI